MQRCRSRDLVKRSTNASALFDAPDAPSVDDLKMCGYLVRFFGSTNVNEMAPHDELRAGGTQYVLAAPGVSYIAYASEPDGAIGLKYVDAGTYSLTWLDPATGKSLTQERVPVSMGEQHWNRPPDFGHAVALYVRPAKMRDSGKRKGDNCCGLRWPASLHGK